MRLVNEVSKLHKPGWIQILSMCLLGNTDGSAEMQVEKPREKSKGTTVMLLEGPTEMECQSEKLIFQNPKIQSVVLSTA